MVSTSYAAIDSTVAQGLAVAPYLNTIRIGEASVDKEKVKAQLVGSYKYFIEYYYNVQKRQDSALIFVDKAIALDPTDTQLISNRDFISKNDPKVQPKKQPATKPKAPASPKAPATPK